MNLTKINSLIKFNQITKRTMTTKANKLIKLSKFGVSNYTSLVIYGTNLSSTVNMGFFSVNLRKLISLPTDNYSVVVGKLLSDGWLERYSLTSNTRFLFKQSNIHANYVIHSFMTLSHYCSNLPYTVKTKVKGLTYYDVGFKTRSLACFNELHDLFYKNKSRS